MSATGDSTGCPHGFQEFFLVLPWVFPWQFHLDVYRLAVRNTMPENIALAMLTDIYDGSVLRVELTDCVVSCYAAVHTQSGDNAVLKFSLFLQGLYTSRLLSLVWTTLLRPNDFLAATVTREGSFQVKPPTRLTFSFLHYA